jgi:hypothetical protein
MILAINDVQSAFLALSVSHMGLVGTVIGLLVGQSRERRAWIVERREAEDSCTQERRQLIDRVIARHTGEVIALDRTDKLGPKEPTPERLIEGLS